MYVSDVLNVRFMKRLGWTSVFRLAPALKMSGEWSIWLQPKCYWRLRTPLGLWTLQVMFETMSFNSYSLVWLLWVLHQNFWCGRPTVRRCTSCTTWTSKQYYMWNLPHSMGCCCQLAQELQLQSFAFVLAQCIHTCRSCLRRNTLSCRGLVVMSCDSHSRGRGF